MTTNQVASQSPPIAVGSPCPDGCVQDWPDRDKPMTLTANIDGELSCPKCWNFFGFVAVP